MRDCEQLRARLSTNWTDVIFLFFRFMIWWDLSFYPRENSMWCLEVFVFLLRNFLLKQFGSLEIPKRKKSDSFLIWVGTKRIWDDSALKSCLRCMKCVCFFFFYHLVPRKREILDKCIGNAWKNLYDVWNTK